MLNLLGVLLPRQFTGRKEPSRRGLPRSTHFRPALESLEDRVVLSASSTAPAMGPAQAGPLAPAAQQAASVIPFTINSVTRTGGLLLANASLGQTPFQIPLNLSLDPASTSATPILDLQLQPIHLDLLGLKVDTSAICLDITAHSGSGNLLGNLLSNVAHLLDRGLSLGDVLGSLNANQLRNLTTGLTNLVGGALNQLTSPTTAASGVSVSSTSTTNILHLSVGPLNLNLLGLQVSLDNCADGPVTIDVSAQDGPGNLLGNLLTDLSNLLNTGPDTGTIVSELEAIGNEIGSLAQQVGSLLPLTITSVSDVNGMLVANGRLGQTPVQIPLTLSASSSPSGSPAAQASTSTPILDLQLNPIHLNLLGLQVDTSAICLDITAQSGSGNLLGNLLADVANLLNNGLPLNQVLGTLESGDLSTLTAGLQSLLNGALGQISSPASVSSVTTASTSSPTNILHLSVGPVDLNLLGLDVHLDNCNNGPVTVDISAQPGPGNLLGNLLGDLANLLNNGAVLDSVVSELDTIASEINALAQQAASILPLTITGVSDVNGMLVANASLGQTQVQIPLTLSASPGQSASPAAAQASTSTPILDLQIQPIHLNLLGLAVDTSAICLDITAQSGSGNLLGNLLADIANLLNNGLTPSQALATLDPTQLNTVTTGLQGLVNGALAQVTSLEAAATGSVTPASASSPTNILNLSLGPVDLNLLGLDVHLDNCNNGPVTIDIAAQPGPGNLLGNLLGGLAHLLDSGAGVASLVSELDNIAGEIQSIAQQVASLLPLNITGVSDVNGSLVANATLGHTRFKIPLTMSLDPASTSATPILDLQIQPIHLNLLGLTVDTSAICLDITAQSGSGNLLGNLLADIAHLLDQGLTLKQALGTLDSTQVSTVTSGLQTVVGEALGQVTALANVAATGSVSSNKKTNILHLSLGPVDLNLLGLDVHLDNCNNGPVTVDISARSGPGHLLGNLLGGLANLLNTGSGIDALIAKLNQITAVILGLV
jgi:hypothetical protein